MFDALGKHACPGTNIGKTKSTVCHSRIERLFWINIAEQFRARSHKYSTKTYMG